MYAKLHVFSFANLIPKPVHELQGSKDKDCFELNKHEVMKLGDGLRPNDPGKERS